MHYLSPAGAVSYVSNHRVQGSGAPVALILGGPPGRLRGSCRLLHLLCPHRDAGSPVRAYFPIRLKRVRGIMILREKQIAGTYSQGGGDPVISTISLLGAAVQAIQEIVAGCQAVTFFT